MVVEMVCTIQIPYKFKFTEPDFTSQPAGDGLVLSPAGFRSALIYTQQAPHQSGDSNSADITLLSQISQVLLILTIVFNQNPGLG